MQKLKKRFKVKNNTPCHSMFSVQNHFHPMTNLFQHVLQNLKKGSSRRLLIRQMMLSARVIHKYKQVWVIQVHRPQRVLECQHLQELRYQHKQYQHLSMVQSHIHQLIISQQQQRPLLVIRHILAIVWQHKLLQQQHKNRQLERLWMMELLRLLLKIHILERALITPLSLHLQKATLFQKLLIYLLQHQQQHLLLD